MRRKMQAKEEKKGLEKFCLAAMDVFLLKRQELFISGGEAIGLYSQDAAEESHKFFNIWAYVMGLTTVIGVTYLTYMTVVNARNNNKLRDEVAHLQSQVTAQGYKRYIQETYPRGEQHADGYNNEQTKQLKVRLDRLDIVTRKNVESIEKFQTCTTTMNKFKEGLVLGEPIPAMNTLEKKIKDQLEVIGSEVGQFNKSLELLKKNVHTMQAREQTQADRLGAAERAIAEYCQDNAQAADTLENDVSAAVEGIKSLKNQLNKTEEYQQLHAHRLANLELQTALLNAKLATNAKGQEQGNNPTGSIQPLGKTSEGSAMEINRVEDQCLHRFKNLESQIASLYEQLKLNITNKDQELKAVDQIKLLEEKVENLDNETQAMKSNQQSHESRLRALEKALVELSQDLD